MGYIRANMPPMPRVKSDQERGATGVWLRRERQRPDRQWTPDDVVRRLADMSYPIRVDYYRGLESGAQRPGPELMAVLRRLYGSEPSPLPLAAPSGDQSDVAAAIDRQTDVMRLLLEELRVQREEPPAWVAGLVSALARHQEANPNTGSSGRRSSASPRSDRAQS